MSLPLPFVAISILFGMCGALFLPTLPAGTLVLLGIAISILLLYLNIKSFINVIACALLGFTLLSWHANQHLLHALPSDLESQKITVLGTISSVVENHKKPNTKFNFNISKIYNNSAEWQLPATVQLSWQTAAKTLQPGDIWKLCVKLKRPRNYANPGSFDTERYFFQQRVVGLGYVVPDINNQKIHSSVLLYPINYLRQELAKFLNSNLKSERFQPILLSLLLGMRANISKEYYEVLQSTGTAHLLAISGLHLSVLAAMVFMSLRFMWRWMPKQFVVFSAPSLAASSALIVCSIYALLAGFSVATQRAIIMLSIFFIGIIFKRKIAAWHAYYLAILLVIIWDPLAILTFGFWFSFLATGLLLYALQQSKHVKQPWYKLYHWLQPQLVLTLGLLPCSVLFFAKVSSVGPIANLIAVPWVSLTVLPLGLLAILIIPLMPQLSVMLLKLANLSLTYLWVILQKLASVPMYMWTLPDKHMPLIIVCSVVGILWLFAPRGVPGRWLGILGLAPLFFVGSVTIPYGHAEFTLLDVGQGLATVIRTQKHVLIYDTGAKISADFDLGSRVVAPYLSNVGAKTIDMIMISHGDNDHAGGAAGILSKFTVHDILASEELDLGQSIRPCIAGQTWEWDGVRFTVLHPEENAYYRKRNDRSCVLMVQAGKHKALLTGDIEKSSEYKLINNYGQHLQADVMLVPHHGSKTSSSIEFLQIVQPKYALIPVGYKNQYGHPKAEVLQRYQEQDIKILRTEEHGAISMTLGGEELQPHSYRQEQRRFWLN